MVGYNLEKEGGFVWIGRPNAQDQGGGRILDVAGQQGRGVVLKIGQFSWDVISASFLKKCEKL